MGLWDLEIKNELERIADCLEEQVKMQKKVIKVNQKIQKELIKKMEEE